MFFCSDLHAELFGSSSTLCTIACLLAVIIPLILRLILKSLCILRMKDNMFELVVICALFHSMLSDLQLQDKATFHFQREAGRESQTHSRCLLANIRRATRKTDMM